MARLEQAGQVRDGWAFVKPRDFRVACAPYSAQATARWLSHAGCLDHEPGRFARKAPAGLFARRLRVYAVHLYSHTMPNDVVAGDR